MGVKRGIRPTPFNFLDVLDTNLPPEGKSQSHGKNYQHVRSELDSRNCTLTISLDRRFLIINSHMMAIHISAEFQEWCGYSLAEFKERRNFNNLVYLYWKITPGLVRVYISHLRPY